MSTPTSSPSSGVRKRIGASPRSAQDLKLRLASADTSSSNALCGLGLVSPLTEVLSRSPSQLQPLTPDVSGRHFTSPGTTPAWSLSSNLLSNSHKNSNRNSSTNRTRVPPALDIVSPTTTSRQSVSGNGRSSLPDLTTRKDVASGSVDASAERCALSPSSASGGRSLAFTPTFETLNNNSAATPQRTSTSTLGDPTTTPPPSAPRSYSKRATGGGGGSRESAPPPRPSLGSGPRTAAQVTSLESPARHQADESTLLLHSQHNVDLMALSRNGDVPVVYDVPHAGPSLGEHNTTHSAGLRHSSRVSAAAASGYYLSSPSAPTTPAFGLSGRSAQTSSILATNAQNSGATTIATTPTISGGVNNNNSNSSSASINRSYEMRGKVSRAPRLASYLFLDTATPDSFAPTSGLQSPPVTEVKKRGSHNSSSSRGRLRTSHGSSEGQVSISTESSNVAMSPVFGNSRPNALNFARGELIGKGSFGAVYRGMQRNTNRIICMKEIRLPGVVEELRKLQQGGMVAEDMSPRATTSTPPPQPSPTTTAASASASTPSAALDEKEKAALLKQLEGVHRELALLKQLNHPNTVKYLNDEIVDGCLRIYMEYVSGGSVASAVKTYGSFAEPQAAALTYQLLQGLVYLHSRGIVHRDLKGDNLLLETSSELKIADFGTAKSVIASATMTANIVGTAYFMAPEVLRPEGQVGTPADIWSTGCCVIEMLTGKPPLSDIPNQYSVMMAIAGSPKVPLEKYIPAENTWSTEVLDFIQQCLRLKPASRPTAQELLQHPWILKYCDGEAMQTVTTTTDSSTTPKMSLMTDHHHSRLTLSGASTAAAAAAAAPTSPDDVVTATSDFAATHTPTASPHPRSPGCSAEAREMSRSATPRERKSKKEKKGGSSRRHHSRDTVGDSSRDGSTYSKETTTHGTPTPPPVGGHRHSEDSPVPLSLNHKSRASDSGVSGAGHPGLAKSGVVGSSRSHFSSGPTNVSVKDDDHQASFSYDYPLPSSGRIVELAAQSSSTFLPAIACASSNALAAAASVTTSVDGMRGTRFARHLNVGSSRDDTRAYHYPNNDDFTSRESMRLGKDFYLDGHDDGRDAADIPVRYGSTTRIPLPDPGLEPGLYSALDCLTAPPTASDLLPSATSRRTTSKRAGRGG